MSALTFGRLLLTLLTLGGLLVYSLTLGGLRVAVKGAVRRRRRCWLPGPSTPPRTSKVRL